MLIAIEIVAVIFNLLYIYFAIKQFAVAWIFGIIASLLSVILFYLTNYIGSATLNLVYGLQGILGYYQWHFKLKDEAPAFRLSFKKHIGLLVGLFGLFGLINFIFDSYFSNALIRLDILLSIGSIAATFLEIRKDISCWYYWIILNIGFTMLYALQHLFIYAVLMILLGVFSFFALQAWKKKMI